MSCILNITGKNFDVDTFILVSETVPYQISYKDFPRFKNKPDGRKNDFISCSFEVSSADFNEFDKQVTDAIEYLKRNRENFKMINLTHGIEHAYLDFGVDYDESKFVQNYFLPNELLKIVSELGISINLSTYNQAE